MTRTSALRCTLTALMVVLCVAGCAENDPPATGPAASPGAIEPITADTLRILAYNIHHGEGMDGKLDLDRIARLISDVDPDLVALQEVDSVVARTDGVDQATVLGELTGIQPLFGPFMDYQGGAYGMALLSRLPVRSHVNYRLPDGDEPRSALSAIVELPESGRPLRFIGIHFYRSEEERLAQAMILESLLEKEDDLPTLLAGDFNSTPGSAVLGHLDMSWHVADKGADRLTYPSSAPEREIDFFMWHPPSSFAMLRQELLEEPVISDHRPLVLDVVVQHPTSRRNP